MRVAQDIDLRRFPPIPRATKQFERLYKGRTSIERINARLKIFWGIDDGQVYGARRFHAHVGAVLILHLGRATLLAQAKRREGPFGQMKLSPIAKALTTLIQDAEEEMVELMPEVADATSDAETTSKATANGAAGESHGPSCRRRVTSIPLLRAPRQFVWRKFSLRSASSLTLDQSRKNERTKERKLEKERMRTSFLILHVRS